MKSSSPKKKSQSRVPVKTPNVKEPDNTESISGSHFWFGCGKVKKKIETIRTKTMKMRCQISTHNLKQVPHPDHWIKQHGTSFLSSFFFLLLSFISSRCTNLFFFFNFSVFFFFLFSLFFFFCRASYYVGGSDGRPSVLAWMCNMPVGVKETYRDS